MRKNRNSLVGKTVMNEKGIPIGVIKESLFDIKSGEIKSLLINPSNKIDLKEFKQNKQGQIILPVDCISTIQDVVVFEKDPLL